MTLDITKILHYYDIPTLISCVDSDNNEKYLFVLLDDTPKYIGVRSDIKINKGLDVRNIFDKSDVFFIGTLTDGKIQSSVYDGEVNDSMLPDHGFYV